MLAFGEEVWFLISDPVGIKIALSEDVDEGRLR